MCLEGEAHSVWRQAGCACVRKKTFIASDVTDRDRETWGGMGLGEGSEVARFLFFFFAHVQSETPASRPRGASGQRVWSLERGRGLQSWIWGSQVYRRYRGQNEIPWAENAPGALEGRAERFGKEKGAANPMERQQLGDGEMWRFQGIPAKKYFEL